MGDGDENGCGCGEEKNGGGDVVGMWVWGGQKIGGGDVVGM